FAAWYLAVAKLTINIAQTIGQVETPVDEALPLYPAIIRCSSDADHSARSIFPARGFSLRSRGREGRRRAPPQKAVTVSAHFAARQIGRASARVLCKRPALCGGGESAVCGPSP